MHPDRQHARMRLAAIVLVLAFAASGGVAQAQAPAAPQAQPAAPQSAPPKPYPAVAVKPAAPLKDPSFDAFRSRLADAVNRKDRDALQKLVVTQGFFWESDTGDKINPKKSSFDNFATAIGLNDKEGTGWEILKEVAGETSLEPIEGRQGVMCGPASPQVDEAAFEALIKATATDAEEWGFPQTSGLQVHATAQATSPVVETLDMNLVRVLPEEPVGDQPPVMLRIVTPSGKVGYVPLNALSPIVFDQMCYIKDAGGWKIAGYAGGD